MKFRDAKNLHNGDEVICKSTGESVKVLSIEVWGDEAPMRLVRIEGIGDKSGYRWWSHTEVR